MKAQKQMLKQRWKSQLTEMMVMVMSTSHYRSLLGQVNCCQLGLNQRKIILILHF
jgi:hypothetical protein